MKEYAYTDNFYSCYVGCDKWKYKHVFRPNALSGRNSASRMRSVNQFCPPQRACELRDNTKNILFISWETI